MVGGSELLKSGFPAFECMIHPARIVLANARFTTETSLSSSDQCERIHTWKFTDRCTSSNGRSNWVAQGWVEQRDTHHHVLKIDGYRFAPPILHGFLPDLSLLLPRFSPQGRNNQRALRQGSISITPITSGRAIESGRTTWNESASTVPAPRYSVDGRARMVTSVRFFANLASLIMVKSASIVRFLMIAVFSFEVIRMALV